MRYAVFGPRDFKSIEYTNQAHVSACLRGLPDLTGVISGGGRGVEKLAQQYAEESSVHFELIKPQFDGIDNRPVPVYQAFELRNTNIIQTCDKVAVFWDGSPGGVGSVLSKCMIMQKTVILYPML